MRSRSAQKKRRQKLPTRSQVVAIVAVAAACALTAAAGAALLRASYRARTGEMLRVAAVQLDERLEHSAEGDWTLNDQGILYRGGRPADEAEAVLRSLRSATGLSYAVYFGREQVLPPLSESAGDGWQPAADTVFSEVVTAGREMLTDTVLAGGQKVQACYVPLKNPDGTIIGIVGVSAPAVGMYAAARGTLALAAIAAALAAVSAAAILLSARADAHRSSRRGSREEKLTRVLRATREVTKDLYDSGADLADSAGVAAGASGYMADKISEVTRGAAVQAESVRHAAGDADGIWQGIDRIAAGTDALGDYSNEIIACSGRVAEALENLAEETARIRAYVREIGESVRQSGETADGLAGFSEVLAGIAAQTNLISLNASIEASRAGDAGRGFAVVAEEIRQLADQSKKSAEEMQAAISRLRAGAAESAALTAGLDERAAAQDERIGDVRSDMRMIADSVRHLGESAEALVGQIDGLDETRMSLTETIRDLAVLSEQNAAFTEETTASMQELHETFTVISESAGQLQVLADDLQETMAFLRV